MDMCRDCFSKHKHADGHVHRFGTYRGQMFSSSPLNYSLIMPYYKIRFTHTPIMRVVHANSMPVARVCCMIAVDASSMLLETAISWVSPGALIMLESWVSSSGRLQNIPFCFPVCAYAELVPFTGNSANNVARGMRRRSWRRLLRGAAAAAASKGDH